VELIERSTKNVCPLLNKDDRTVYQYVCRCDCRYVGKLR